jgi:hypothetical protein
MCKNYFRSQSNQEVGYLFKSKEIKNFMEISQGIWIKLNHIYPSSLHLKCDGSVSLKSLINLQIEINFGKLFELLRFYEKCYKYSHVLSYPIEDLKLCLNEE